VGQCGVTERMINPDDALLGKPVMLAQRLPAILTVQKFMGEPDLEFGMPSQIADGANSEALRFAASHDQRVSVVEPKWLCHANAGFSECVSNFMKRKLLTVFQNFLRDCSRVFGIGINLSALERLPENDCAAHSLAMFRCNPGIV